MRVEMLNSEKNPYFTFFMFGSLGGEASLSLFSTFLGGEMSLSGSFLTLGGEISLSCLCL